MGGISSTVHPDSIYCEQGIPNQFCAKISPSSYLPSFMVWTELSSVQVEERTKCSFYHILILRVILILNPIVVTLTNVNNFIVVSCSISDLTDRPFLPDTSDSIPSGFRWDHNTELLNFVMFKLLQQHDRLDRISFMPPIFFSFFDFLNFHQCKFFSSFCAISHRPFIIIIY
jgi:hypothetical protein